MSRAARAARVERPAEFYNQQNEYYANNDVVELVHSDTTKINMHTVKLKWERHCEHLSTLSTINNVDPIVRLRDVTKSEIETFLIWMLDKYERIRKRSTIHTYKRMLFRVYEKSLLEYDPV